MVRHRMSFIRKVLRVFCGIFCCVHRENEETEEDESEEVREVEKEGEFVQ